MLFDRRRAGCRPRHLATLHCVRPPLAMRSTVRRPSGLTTQVYVQARHPGLCRSESRTESSDKSQQRVVRRGDRTAGQGTTWAYATREPQLRRRSSSVQIHLIRPASAPSDAHTPGPRTCLEVVHLMKILARPKRFELLTPRFVVSKIRLPEVSSCFPELAGNPINTGTTCVRACFLVFHR